MIVVVTGSRKLLQHPQRIEIKAEFLRIVHALHPTKLHHGGAAGPDSWAALEFPDNAKVHRPQPTNTYADAVDALFQRNHHMIDDALVNARIGWEGVILVACWDGKSRGTKDAMDYAQSVMVPVVSVPVGLFERIWRLQTQ